MILQRLAMVHSSCGDNELKYVSLTKTSHVRVFYAVLKPTLS